MGVRITDYLILGYKLDPKEWRKKEEQLHELCEDNSLTLILDCYDDEYLFIGYVIASAKEEDGDSMPTFSFNSIWKDEVLLTKVTDDLQEVFAAIGEFPKESLDCFYLKHYS